MRLLKRVNRVIAAQLHEAVECFENPERVMKQTIREMETTLQRVTESTARAIASEKQLERRLAETRTQVDRCQTRAAEAIKKGDERAARVSLERRFEFEARAAALAAHLERTAESNGRLRLQLDQLRGRLAEAKTQMGVAIARQRSANAQRQFAKLQAAPALDLESFNFFDELALRVEEAETEAEALSGLCATEPQDVVRNQDVERELQSLKAQCEPPRDT